VSRQRYARARYKQVVLNLVWREPEKRMYFCAPCMRLASGANGRSSSLLKAGHVAE
jgi:hypothetical protein